MEHKPAATQMVSVFEKPPRRTVLDHQSQGQSEGGKGARRQGDDRGDRAEGDALTGLDFCRGGPATC